MKKILFKTLESLFVSAIFSMICALAGFLFVLFPGVVLGMFLELSLFEILISSVIINFFLVTIFHMTGKIVTNKNGVEFR